MIDIDRTAAKAAGGSRFALATIVALRARQIEMHHAGAFAGERPVSVALEEAASGQLRALDAEGVA